MTYPNKLDSAEQLAEDTGDRISMFGTFYTLCPDEIVLINESESARTIAAVTAGITTDFQLVNSGGRSFREVTQNVIDEINADNSHQLIDNCVEMVLDECKVTNVTFSVNKQTLSAIVEVSMHDLYQHMDMLADYFKLYLLIVSKITKLKVGKLRICVLDSYVLKSDIDAIRDMPNNNTAKVVLAETLTELNFTADDISLKT